MQAILPDVTCFEECGCVCNEGFEAFDSAIASEMASHLKLREVLEHRVVWYHDQTVELEDDGFGRFEVRSWGLSETSGVYVLWRQAGYCTLHECEHMQAFYVGKAGRNVESRLMIHRDEKSVSDTVLATYVSIWPCANRLAKYIEQLLLDLYDFPLNTSENHGTRRLCHDVGPGSWN